MFGRSDVSVTLAADRESLSASQGYTGSVSCRQCHEKFYKLWAPSHHDQAMEPHTEKLAQGKLTAEAEDIVIGKCRYRAEIEPGGGWVLERGPKGESKYPIQHAHGGKNVYYLLLVFVSYLL